MRVGFTRFGCGLMLVVMTLASDAISQIAMPEYVYIDGSRLPGSTDPLPETYQIQPGDFNAWGVSITVGDGQPGFPIVARRGDPLVAFLGNGGSDAPLAPGGDGFPPETAITDPLGPGGDSSAFRPLRFAFSPPANTARVCVTKLAETGTGPIVTFSSTTGNTSREFAQNPQFRQYRRGLRNGVWDAPTTMIDFTESAAGNIGYAIGALMILRTPATPQAAMTGPFVRVAQESAPGAGDFDQHVLGVVRPVRSPSAVAPLAKEVYAYERNVITNNNSYGGLREEFGLAPLQSTFYFADTTDGLGLFVVHSNGSNGVPAGTAALQIAFSGFSGPLVVPVIDDPEQQATFDASNRLLTAVQAWDGGFTDGFAVCGMNGGWQAIAHFDSFNNGLVTWSVSSTDGPSIPLALEVGRRVQFAAVANCLAVNSPPNGSVCSGGTIVFTAQARTTNAGGTTGNQWRKGGQNLTNGGHYSGVTTPSLTISNATAAEAGLYDCVVGNACGSVSTVPAMLILVVHASGDGNGDGMVNGLDIGGMIIAILSGGTGACAYDMNSDGVTNIADLPLFISRLLN